MSRLGGHYSFFYLSAQSPQNPFSSLDMYDWEIPQNIGYFFLSLFIAVFQPETQLDYSLFLGRQFQYRLGKQLLSTSSSICL